MSARARLHLQIQEARAVAVQLAELSKRERRVVRGGGWWENSTGVREEHATPARDSPDC